MPPLSKLGASPSSAVTAAPVPFTLALIPAERPPVGSSVRTPAAGRAFPAVAPAPGSGVSGKGGSPGSGVGTAPGSGVGTAPGSGAGGDPRAWAGDLAKRGLPVEVTSGVLAGPDGVFARGVVARGARVDPALTGANARGEIWFGPSGQVAAPSDAMIAALDRVEKARRGDPLTPAEWRAHAAFLRAYPGGRSPANPSAPGLAPVMPDFALLALTPLPSGVPEAFFREMRSRTPFGVPYSREAAAVLGSPPLIDFARRVRPEDAAELDRLVQAGNAPPALRVYARYALANTGSMDMVRAVLERGEAGLPQDALPTRTGLPGGDDVARVAEETGLPAQEIARVRQERGVSAQDAANILKSRIFGRWTGTGGAPAGTPPLPPGSNTATAAGGDEDSPENVARNIATADPEVVRKWWSGLSAAEREALPQTIRDAAYTKLGPLPSLPRVRVDATEKPRGYPDRAGDILDHLDKKREDQIDRLTESEARWVHDRLSNALDHRQLPSRQVDAAANLIEQIERRLRLPARDSSLTLAPDHITTDEVSPVFDRSLTPSDRKEIDRLERRWRLPAAVATEIVRRYGDNQKADIAAETFLLLRKRNVDEPVAAALVGSRAGVTLIAALARGDMIPPKFSQGSAAALAAQLSDLVDSAGSRLNLSRENASRWVGKVLTSADSIAFERAKAVPAVAELVEKLAPFAAGPDRLEALELRGKVFAAAVADGAPLADAISVASRPVPNETLVRLGRLYQGTEEEEAFHVGRMLESSRTTLNIAVEYLKRSKGSDAVLRFVLDKIRRDEISLSKADEVERAIVPASRAQSLAGPILEALREKGGVSITLDDGIAYVEPGTPAHEGDGESGPIQISHIRGMGFIVVAHGSNGYRAGDTFVAPHISNLYDTGETILLLDENANSVIELRLPNLGR
jgi:hypothetical protein